MDKTHAAIILSRKLICKAASYPFVRAPKGTDPSERYPQFLFYKFLMKRC
jgi:hypothetical protein